METLQQVLIIVGMGGFVTLWVAAAAGVMQIAWNTIMTPILDRFSDR